MLAWHVDYWDYLGWKDTFGSKRFSARQRAYAKALGMKGIGTPFFYVDNKRVRASRVGPAVKEASKRPPKLLITARAELKQGKVIVGAQLKRLDNNLKLGAGTRVFPVLYVRRATTACTAGENKGKTLREVFAVLDAARPRPFSESIQHTFKAPKGVATKDLGVAILVEDPATMKTIECVAVGVS